MLSTKRAIGVWAFGWVAWAAAASVAGAATLPFAENFDDGAAPDFSSAAAYTIQPDAPSGNVYQAVISSTAGAANSTSAVQVTNAVGSSFRVATEFTVDEFTTAGTSTLNLGLGILSNTANLSDNNQYRVLFTLAATSNVGRITIQEGGTTVATSAAALPVTLDVPYTLSVDVTYAGANPTLAAVVTQGTNTITAAYTDTASPFAGQFFGYRTAVNAVGGSVSENIDYDNFSVTVPEPGSIASVGVVGLALARRSRRRYR